MSKLLILFSLLASPALFAQSAAPAADPPVTLDALYSEITIVDAAISPNGRYLAIIARRESDDVLAVVDLQTNERKIVQRAGFTEAGKSLVMHMNTVYWKSDERLLFRIAIRPEEDSLLTPASTSKISKLGDRLYAINRDGTKMVVMLGENRNSALAGSFDLGAISSFLPNDPSHILMLLDGFNGRSLFKVNVDTGVGVQVERPSESVYAWWLDVNGNPVVRVTISSGSVRFFRKEADGKWRKFYSARFREMREKPDYESVGPSDQEGMYYVLARPPGKDRTGLYLYDLTNEKFGEPVIEHPTYDLDFAQILRDGKRVVRHCYMAHVRICSFSDPKVNAHMKGIRKFFEESANVYVWDSSDNGQTMLLYVEGPLDPPSYYYYLTDKHAIEPLGTERKALDRTARPRAEVINYKARDGKELSGYLTAPPGSAVGTKLPVVVMPHGGPEARDNLTYSPWVQFMAARGYAVFQPNFRGSDGFGRAFAESGYGEWGRKMQDDITDGLQALVDKGVADPARACIVGASYGGYAALAGATLTPDVYKCAVSIAGISDLDDFIGWRKRNWGSDSEGYTYWLKAIGDPDQDAKRLSEVSPLQQVSRVKIPILLIHGVDDSIVPIAQSKAMKKALDKSGRKTELISLEKEDHSYWSTESDKRALIAIDNFLWQNLGPGYGITAPPAKQPAAKK